MEVIKLEVIDLELLLGILPTGTFLLDEEDNICIMLVQDYEDFKLDIAECVVLQKELTIK